MAKRLLIIDNDPEVLNVMQEALVYEGFEVKILEETDGVFAVIAEYNPDSNPTTRTMHKRAANYCQL